MNNSFVYCFKLYCVVCFFFANVCDGLAQQSILLNQSAYNLFTLNSAALGLNSATNFNFHYKKNWLGLSESPEALQLTIDGPVQKKNIGWGINFVKERAGIFSKTIVSLATNYKLKIANDQNIHFGLSFGMNKVQSDFSKIIADHQDEFDLWPQQQSITQPDASFGMVYKVKRFLVAVSANQLLQRPYNFNEPVYNSSIQYQSLSHFVLVTNYTFYFATNLLQFVPQICLRSTKGLGAQIDVNGTFTVDQKIILGLGYRNNYALYGNFGYVVNESFRVIYSYEYALGIQNYTHGGHEIGLYYSLFSMKGNKKTIHSNRNDENTDALGMQLDLQKQNINNLQNRIDSLDKNIKSLNEQFQQLKLAQISTLELEQQLKQSKNTMNKDETEKTTTHSQSNQSTSEILFNETQQHEENDESTFQIVLGVYQLHMYAKEFQKLLQRELYFETKVIQLPNHPKNYLYVCLNQTFTQLDEAIIRMNQVNEITRQRSIEITNGKCWILKTTQK